MTKLSRSCGIAFGSNLGDRLANLSEAKRLLIERVGTPEGTAFSAVYESAPVGCDADAGAFLNAVGEIPWDGSPGQLLEHCQRIESELGRPSRRPKNASRTVDLDVLYVGELVIETPQLSLPHPRLAERRFVLEPLAMIRPELRLPGHDAAIGVLSKNLVSDEPPLRMVATDW